MADTLNLSGCQLPSMPMAQQTIVQTSDEVATALSEHRPVVALESTIFSSLGLPSPSNVEALARCEAAIRASGAVPAVTAIVDGIARVGLTGNQVERVLAGTHKCAERDLPVHIARKTDIACTTVSATVALCAAVGVRVFATGGMGGVHRDDHLTGDVSADLGALARHPVLTVTAGAKAFLDLRKTLELLDTLGVPVLGLRTDRFPAFYTRDSGFSVAHRVETEAEAAEVLMARFALGLPGGVVLANPIPVGAELPTAEVDDAINTALADAELNGLRGAGVTPFLLGRLAEVTGGRSVPANLALAEHNALVGGRVAAALRA
jgi:pseudouridylate synthase